MYEEADMGGEVAAFLQGYPDIFNEEALYNYFINEVLDKREGYLRPLGDEPIPTMYYHWLDETYRKTAMGRFWEYISDIDRIQMALDVAGIFWDGFDVINAVIYFLRGDYLNMSLSLVGAIPIVGSYISKELKVGLEAAGGAKAVARMAMDSITVVADEVKLSLKTAPDIVQEMLQDIGKLLKEFDGMMAKLDSKIDDALFMLSQNTYVKRVVVQLQNVGANLAKEIKGWIPTVVFELNPNGTIRMVLEGGDKTRKLIEKADDIFNEIRDALRYGDELLDGASGSVRRTEGLLEGGSETVRGLISRSDAATKWGILDDGTNQGVRHFCDYWEQYPERIPSLEQRLGVSEGAFGNSVEGFNNFTSQAERVIR